MRSSPSLSFSLRAFALHHSISIKPLLLSFQTFLSFFFFFIFSLVFEYHKMGRPPCCDKSNVKKGLWTEEEDAKILAYVAIHGVGNWSLIPKKAGFSKKKLSHFS